MERVPTAEQLQTQAAYYKTTLDACIAVAKCNSFTIWGFTDKYSWVPGFFDGQGEATPLDANLDPKPAYRGLQQTLALGRVR